MRLAKGFLRSVINQVGRDTGRKISNRIYKGAHATPVYRADQFNNNNTAYEITKNNGGDYFILKMILGLFLMTIPILGAIILFQRAY